MDIAELRSLRPALKRFTKKFEDYFGATWAFEEDPVQGARLMIDHIDKKRAALGLSGTMYDVPYKGDS